MSSSGDALTELAEQLPALAPPRDDAPRRARLPWHQRAREAVVAYLPVLLMTALALATWWLVKNTPLPEVPVAEAPPRHEPDYTMNNFSVQRFAPDGALRVQIDGAQMRHYPDTDTLEIDAPRIRATSPDGRVTLASAKRAVSSGDGSQVQLIGDAQVLREPTAGREAIEFRGEFLHAFLDTERVQSHLPVTVRQGATQFRANGLRYDHLAGTVDLQGPMRGSFPARPAR